MTDLAVRLPVAGWYKDPANAERLRWWTGETWSQHTIERPTKKDDLEASDERPRSRGAHRAVGEPDVAAAAREAGETHAITTGEIATFIAAETGQTPAVTTTPVIVEPAGDELVAATASEQSSETQDDEAADLDAAALASTDDADAPVDATAPVQSDDDAAADALEIVDAESATDHADPATSEVEAEPAPRAASLVPEVMETSANAPLLEQLAAAPPPLAVGAAPASASSTDVVVAASGVSFDELMKQLPFAVDPAVSDETAAGKPGKGRKAAKAAKAARASKTSTATTTPAAASSALARPTAAPYAGGTPARATGTQTAGVWLLALLPLIAVLLATAAIVLPMVVPAIADFALLGAAALTLLLGVVFAAADDSALAKRGVEKRVTAVIALLTPLPYLALRTLSLGRQQRNGVAPLAVFVVLIGAAAAGYLLAGDRLPELITLVQSQSRALLGL
ncbi:DUF2510 domain-containing protein [Schumannella soli]|uniref:DUF2510 domain-containing protein n=1 Tax=Schumannella soli TaxID=2590779 RepID=UPI0015E841AE|nr:DUF2510 domain-containing protein [Schumannella soli]